MQLVPHSDHEGVGRKGNTVLHPLGKTSKANVQYLPAIYLSGANMYYLVREER